MLLLYKNILARFSAPALPISLLASLFLAGCGGVDPAALLSSGTKKITVPDPVASRPQTTVGWLDEYSSAIETNVSTNYPELLALDASRMRTVCPSWSALSAAERETFWSSLLWSIAGPESDRDRTAIYRESTLPIDPVTGVQIRSEGLLQLSYGDVPAYKYPGGDVSWVADRVSALSDYAKGLARGDPARTILNAYSNLNLGLWIMYRRLVELGPTETFESALGHYWSSMRSGSSAFSRVLSGLRGLIPRCF